MYFKDPPLCRVLRSTGTALSWRAPSTSSLSWRSPSPTPGGAILRSVTWCTPTTCGIVSEVTPSATGSPGVHTYDTVGSPLNIPGLQQGSGAQGYPIEKSARFLLHHLAHIRAPGQRNRVRDGAVLANKKRVIKMLLIVVILFTLSWLPYQVSSISSVSF